MSYAPPRRLGVVEAFTAVVSSCPNGAAQTVARHALEAVKRGGAAAMPEQAFLVLTAVRGWRGEKAAQVKAALEAFLASLEPPAGG